MSFTRAQAVLQMMSSDFRAPFISDCYIHDAVRQQVMEGSAHANFFHFILVSRGLYRTARLIAQYLVDPIKTSDLDVHDLRRLHHRVSLRTRRAHLRNVELHAARTGRIGRSASYASNASHDYRVDVKTRQKAFEASAELTCCDESIPFADIAQTAQKRASELYVRVLGQQEYAARRGLTAIFISPTLPPEFHPAPTRGACSWSGIEMHDAVRVLQKQFKRFHDLLRKSNIRPFGFKAIEPHKDGTPHGHAVYYIDDRSMSAFLLCVRKVWPRDARSTSDKDDLRCRVVVISPEEAQKDGKTAASAASYIMKYVMKELFSDDPEEITTRVQTWKYINSVRSFEVIDIKGSATRWRELRRVKYGTEAFDEIAKHKTMFAAWQAATGGFGSASQGSLSYADFLECLERLDGVFIVVYEAISDISRRVSGFLFSGIEILTHTKRWVISRPSFDPYSTVAPPVRAF